MHWYIKGLTLVGMISSLNASCAIQVCIPQASCAIEQQLIRVVGEEFFIKEFFDPIINNANGMMQRHGASRILNMAKNEKMKSRAFEAVARLEMQRYYINKKEAENTVNMNSIKKIQIDTELLSSEVQTLRSEMMLYLISDKSNQRIGEQKRNLVGSQ